MTFHDVYNNLRLCSYITKYYIMDAPTLAATKKDSTLRKVLLNIIKCSKILGNCLFFSPQFKTWIVYFWNFPFFIFEPEVDHVTETAKSRTIGKGGTTVLPEHPLSLPATYSMIYQASSLQNLRKESLFIPVPS